MAASCSTCCGTWPGRKTTHAVVIANPASGHGRGSRLIPRVRAAFALVGISDLRETERSGDEVRLVNAALDAGADTIAVLGGDGTWSKCAAALASSRADARLTLPHSGGSLRPAG